MPSLATPAHATFRYGAVQCLRRNVPCLEVADWLLTGCCVLVCLHCGQVLADACLFLPQSACESCLPLLLDKLGDSNNRIRDASKESIMFIAGLKDSNIRNATHLFVKPVKNQSAWKLLLGILGLLEELVPAFGISKTGDGFELGELMEFVGKAYNSPNADVRSTAIKVTKEVHDIVGPAIRKTLPKDINPKIKEQLDAVLGGDAMPAPAAAAPPPPVRNVSARATSGNASKAGPAAKNKAAAKVPAAPPPPPPPPPPMAPGATSVPMHLLGCTLLALIGCHSVTVLG